MGNRWGGRYDCPASCLDREAKSWVREQILHLSSRWKTPQAEKELSPETNTAKHLEETRQYQGGKSCTERAPEICRGSSSSIGLRTSQHKSLRKLSKWGVGVGWASSGRAGRKSPGIHTGQEQNLLPPTRLENVVIHRTKVQYINGSCLSSGE